MSKKPKYKQLNLTIPELKCLIRWGDICEFDPQCSFSPKKDRLLLKRIRNGLVELYKRQTKTKD